MKRKFRWIFNVGLFYVQKRNESRFNFDFHRIKKKEEKSHRHVKEERKKRGRKRAFNFRRVKNWRSLKCFSWIVAAYDISRRTSTSERSAARLILFHFFSSSRETNKRWHFLKKVPPKVFDIPSFFFIRGKTFE